MIQELDVQKIRKDFPMLQNQNLIYLDSSATSQKPYSVIRAVTDFYENCNANPLRGLYETAQNATEKYEAAREKVRQFIHAKSTEEIIFTRNATESLNLVAYSYGLMAFQPGDEILVSIMEHHSDMLPWQQAAKRTGAVVKYLECTEDGKYTEEAFRAALSDRTKVVAMTQVSNVLGCKNDIKHFAQIAHESGAYFVADGAQSVPHMAVDVQDLDVDFWFIFRYTRCMLPLGSWCVICEERTVGADASFPCAAGESRSIPSAVPEPCGRKCHISSKQER